MRKSVIALAGTALLVGATAAYAQYRSIEQPDYETVKQEGAYQLRDYAPMLVAEVTHTGERRRALSAGFRRLAAYIFAEDRPDQTSDESIAMTAPVIQDPPEKIAMTSPVLQDGETSGSWRTRFVMPSKYTLETLPRAPEDITLTEVPARRMAVVRFSGWGGNEDLAEMEQRLRGWMADQQIAAAGPAEYAFYDAPMVPGPFRRNEVMIPIGS